MPIPAAMLAGILSSVMTNIGNIALSERQANRNHAFMEEQNDYNLPINQVQRLKEAGINPTSLGMGQGLSIQGNTSEDVNPYTMAQLADPMTLASNSLLSMMQGEEAGEKAESERTFRGVRAEHIEAEANKYRKEAVLLGFDAESQRIANQYADALGEIAVYKGNLDLDLESWQITELQRGIEKMEAELWDVIPQQIKESKSREALNILAQDEVVARIAALNAEAGEREEHANLMREQEVTERTEQYSNMAEGVESGQNANYIAKQCDFYLQTWEDRINQIAWDTKMSKRQVKWYIVNMLLNGAKDIGVAAGGAAAAGKAIKAIGAMP